MANEKKEKVDLSKVSQSTKKVTFTWSKGSKAKTKEVMSQNVAEIMEAKGLGKYLREEPIED